MNNIIKSIAIAGVASVAMLGAANADVPQNDYIVFGDYSIFSTQADTASNVPTVQAQGDFDIEQAGFISPEYGNRVVEVVNHDEKANSQSSLRLSSATATDPEAAYLGNFFGRPEYPL